MSALSTDLSATFSEIGTDVGNLDARVTTAENTISAQGDAINELDTRLDAVGERTYITRLGATQDNVPADVQQISVIHNGIKCDYIRSADHTALTTADGGTWGPAGDYFYAEHYGLTPLDKGAGGVSGLNPDAQPVLQTAINENAATHCSELRLTGYLRLSDQLTIPNMDVGTGSKDFNIVGTREVEQCGFAILNDFNMSADGVIMCGYGSPGIHIDEITVWFVQPTNPVNYAGVIQYPPAVNARTAPRGHIGKIRIVGGWNGIDLYDDTNDSGQNPGQWRIDHVQSSCFNYTVWAANALGFITIGIIHKWFYNLSPEQIVVQQYGQTRALVAEDNDNLSVDRLECFQSGVEINGVNYDTSNDGHNLPVVINSLFLDGDGSTLYLNGSTSLIGNYYATNGLGSVQKNIVCTGGEHTISSMALKTADQYSIDVSGGALQINGGRISAGWFAASLSGQVAARVTDGQLSMSNVSLASFNGVRTVPIVQQSGTGILRLTNCYPQLERYEGGPLVGFGSDVEGNLLNCPELPLSAVAADIVHRNGVYNTKDKHVAAADAAWYNVQSVFSDSVNDRVGTYVGKGRGDHATPTDVVLADIVRDDYSRAWYGGGWKTTGLIRNYVDLLASNPTGAYDFFVGNGLGGTFRTMKQAYAQTTIYNQLAISAAGGTSPTGVPLWANSGTADIVALFESTDTAADLMISDDVGAVRMRNTGGIFQLFVGNGPGAVGGGNNRFEVGPTLAKVQGVALAVGPSSAGGKLNQVGAIAIGDSDTGIRQNGENVLEVIAGNTTVMAYRSGSVAIGKDVPDGNATAGVEITTLGTISGRNDSAPVLAARRDGVGNFATFSVASGIIGSISHNGTTTSFNTTSDYRLKANASEIDSAIDKLMALAPKEYNFIGTEVRSTGFFAHELQEVLPEAVTGVKDGPEYQQVDYSKVVPLLTAALQEAILRIEELEAKLTE